MPSSRAELILDPLALRELAFVARIADQVPRIAETAAEVPVGEASPQLRNTSLSEPASLRRTSSGCSSRCRTCSASG